jgi:hypothetical protein
MTRQNKLMPKGGQNVTFPGAWRAFGHDIDRLLKKGSLLQALDVKLRRGLRGAPDRRCERKSILMLATVLVENREMATLSSFSREKQEIRK